MSPAVVNFDCAPRHSSFSPTFGLFARIRAGTRIALWILDSCSRLGRNWKLAGRLPGAGAGSWWVTGKCLGLSMYYVFSLGQILARIVMRCNCHHLIVLICMVLPGMEWCNRTTIR